MAKLSTTIDKIELNSNKVIGTTPSSSWTDTQYPSAKTLYNTYNSLNTNINTRLKSSELLNLTHPVGSIMITAANTSPASTIGGTWELIDKAFKDTYLTLDSTYWTKTNANIAGYSNIMLNDHSISLRLCLETTTAITAAKVDNTYITMGTLDIASLGITALSHTIFNAVAFSDDGQCTVCYKLNQEGQIDIYDILNADGTHTMASGSSFYIYLVQPINYTSMKNDFCNKFYWKRTK